MPEVADLLPDPDPEVVAAIASLLVELPTDRIGFHLSRVLDQLYAGIRAEAGGTGCPVRAAVRPRGRSRRSGMVAFEPSERDAYNDPGPGAAATLARAATAARPSPWRRGPVSSSRSAAALAYALPDAEIGRSQACTACCGFGVPVRMRSVGPAYAKPSPPSGCYGPKSGLQTWGEALVVFDLQSTRPQGRFLCATWHSILSHI